jgi:hypothetical protein
MHVHAGGMEHMGELRFFERFDITLQLSSTIFNYLQLSSTRGVTNKKKGS